MPIYDSETYERSFIPEYLKKEIREIIETAVLFGWKMHVSSANSVTIVSYDERKKYHFSRTNRASKSLHQIKRDIIKFGEPEKVIIADQIIGGSKDRGEMELLANTLLPKVGAPGTVVDHRPEIEAERERQDQRKARLRAAREVEKVVAQHPLGGAVSTGNPQTVASPPLREEVGGTPRIVSEQPMMAKAREGHAYESRVAIERRWSDGSVDYKCVDCEYTSKDRLAIRGHRTRRDHNPRGVERSLTFAAEVPNAVQYRPNKNRVAALAEALAAIIAGGETDPEVIAREALTWVHEQSRKGTVHADEREPMTPEETLDRIRALLDTGAQVEALREKDEQMEGLRGEVEILRAESNKLQERLVMAEAKAADAQSTLDSFIELANELRKGA